MSALQKQGGYAKKSLFLLLIVIAIASTGWYFYAQSNQEKKVPYITAAVQRGDIVAGVLATGTLEAFKQVDVGAQVSGEIDKLLVKVGDKVKAGELLAEIDAATQRNNQQTAKATLQSREAGLQAAQASLQEAEQIYRRQKGLLNKGIASQEAMERANTALQSARAAVAQAKAAVEIARVDLNNAGLNLSHASVTAPIDGTVVAVLVEQGQTVSAMQNVPTLVRIAQTDMMTVKAEISEADIDKVKPGMKSQFHLFGGIDKGFDSVLESVDPAPIGSSGGTSASGGAVYYYGKLNIDNPDHVLRIGMTANINIITDEAKGALVVPLTALHKNAHGADSVEVLQNGQAVSRRVQVGINDGVNVQIIDGLEENEQVIISQGEGTSPKAFRGRF